MRLAILQARTSSRRLPGKVLMPILGEPMLARQIERIRRASRIDTLIVATSDRRDDEPIAALARDCGVDCFRGSLTDVLDRFHAAATWKGAETVVRLTGDCPLADWTVIDRVIEFFEEGRFDYASNTHPPTWPDGLDVEVVAASALRLAWESATQTDEREHVTPYLYRHPERFALGNLANDRDLSGLRWTVDTPADFAFVSRIYDRLYPAKENFLTDDVLRLLSEEPEISLVNAERA